MANEAPRSSASTAIEARSSSRRYIKQLRNHRYVDTPTVFRVESDRYGCFAALRHRIIEPLDVRGGRLRPVHPLALTRALNDFATAVAEHPLEAVRT